MTNKQCTMIMYHYVRELPLTRFPDIKGLLVSEFTKQLDYLSSQYEFVSMQDCIEAIYQDKELPHNACLLTFDDGYLDHFTNVFPILNERKIQGCFFPPAKAILNNEVLDVNKIHFVLAAATNKKDLIKDVYVLLDQFRDTFNLKSNDYYFSKLAIENRFDPKEVIFIKRLLQRELDMDVRKIITDQLFKKYVTSDEASFACELYMNVDQLKCLLKNGMLIGGHSYDHVWLETLSIDQKEKEVDLTMDFLAQIGVSLENWVMNYPYGSYDDDLVTILNRKNCALGLTSIVGIANLNRENAFSIERLDTNDVPKESNALPDKWARKVLQTIKV